MADALELDMFQMGFIQQGRDIHPGKDHQGYRRIVNGQFAAVDHQPGLVFRSGKIISLHGAEFAPARGVLEHVPQVFLFQLMAQFQGIDHETGEFLAPGQEQEIPFQLPVHRQVLLIEHVQPADYNGQLHRFPAGSLVHPFPGQFPQRLGNSFFTEGIHQWFIIKDTGGGRDPHVQHGGVFRGRVFRIGPEHLINLVPHSSHCFLPLAVAGQIGVRRPGLQQYITVTGHRSSRVPRIKKPSLSRLLLT